VGVLKYDLNGNQLWEENTTEGGEDGDVHVDGFALDGLGDVYFVADYLGGTGERYQTYKYNSDGSSGWDTGNPTYNGYSTAHGLALDNATNVLVTGQAPSNFTSDNSPLFSYATFKLNTNGSVLWGDEYPQVSHSASIATSIAVDDGNNVYVTGNSQITKTGSDIATIKYDSNGNQLWLQRYDGPGHGNDAGNAIAVDNGGNVYVAGYETETNGNTEMVLIKYSSVTLQKQPNGSVILQAYGAPGESFDLQASTNLHTWQDLGDVIADTNGLVQFDDTNAPSFPFRFYYAVPK